MKKILIVLILIFILTGCTSIKVKKSGENFKSVLEKYNFNATDYSSEYDIYDSEILYEDDDYYLKYIDTKKGKDSEGLFIDECRNAISNAGDDYKKFSKAGDNWASLIVYNSDSYFYVSWVDDSFIYLKSTIDNKDIIKKIVKDLEY